MKSFGILCGILMSAFIANAQSDTLKTASGLRYVILKEGDGPAIEKGDNVMVQYTGRFGDGSIFDDSGKKAIKVQAGSGQVIKGWDEMLLLMHPGDEVDVFIPANLAYGANGVPDSNDGYRIPPDSDLWFRMKLVGKK